MRNSAASLPATSCFFCVQPEDRRRIPAGSQGPGIPNPQIPYENLPSNAVSHEILMISQLRPTGLFYIMNALPVLSVKSGLIAFIYPELCFYDLFHKFRRLADQKNIFSSDSVCRPRFFAFCAAFCFCSVSYPQHVQKKRPSCLLPMAPHLLHSMLMPFPKTSTNSTDCS